VQDVEIGVLQVELRVGIEDLGNLGFMVFEAMPLSRPLEHRVGLLIRLLPKFGFLLALHEALEGSHRLFQFRIELRLHLPLLPA
jgi:hypothetical protein